MDYFGWSDSDKKKEVNTKIEEGAERFEYRFGRRPSFVFLSANHTVTDQVAGIDTKGVDYINASNFWFGPIEGLDAESGEGI